MRPPFSLGKTLPPLEQDPLLVIVEHVHLQTRMHHKREQFELVNGGQAWAWVSLQPLFSVVDLWLMSRGHPFPLNNNEEVRWMSRILVLHIHP